MPRSALNRSPTSNSTGSHLDLAGFDLGEIEQIVDQLGQVLGCLAHEPHLRFLLCRQRTVAALDQQLRQSANRVERGAKLMAHVRQKARLHLVGAAQVIGLFVELCVQRDHAAIGVFQLAIQPHQLVLALAQLRESLHQLLVLLLHFAQRIVRGQGGKLRRELGQPLRRDELGVRGQQLLENHCGAAVRNRANLTLVHQAARAQNAQAHAGRGLILSGQDARQIADARPVVDNAGQ